MTYKRQTLVGEAHFEGLGLHTGEPTVMTVRPADDGIHFIYKSSRTKAHPENVTDTTRSTKLGEVGTIEHIMSALAGLELTDAEVEVSAPEIPGMDGSAMPFIEGLLAAGVQEIGDATVPDLYSRVFLQEDEIKVAVSKGTGIWRFEFETGDRWPKSMHFERDVTPAVYLQDIASARTFAFAEEVPHIIQLGLGRGLDEHSALVLGIEGYKNDPRFEDEPARHKLLDVIGDLYLAGIPIRALNVVAHRSGHRANVQVAAMLAKATS